MKYGLGVLATSMKFRLQKMHIGNFRIFRAEGSRLLQDYYSLADKHTQ